MYKVSFYTPYRKVSPIRRFMDSCQPSLRTKILRQFKYVEEYGLNSAIPNIKKLSGANLWELRILGKDNVRIICTERSRKKVKVLHIFRKKKRKTPPRELNVAMKRLQEILD